MAMLVPAHRSRLWLLLGAFALLGLFAMHGLGGHGMNHAGASQPHPPVTHAWAGTGNVVGTSEPGHGVDPATHDRCHGTCAADAMGHIPMGSGSGGGSSLVMALCLAVLAALAATAALALSRVRLAVRQPPRLVGRVGIVLRSARDRDPPRIYLLSVQRC